MKFGQLRTATSQDLARITELFQASYPALIQLDESGEVTRAALPLMSQANPRLIDSGRFIIVHALDDPHSFVGCGGWSPEWPGTQKCEPGVAHLRHFATHPEAVRQGVGQAIIRRCFAEGSLLGLTHWHVFSSRNAIPFYQRAGFGEPVEIFLDFPGGLKVPSWHMQCDVPTPTLFPKQTPTSNIDALSALFSSCNRTLCLESDSEGPAAHEMLPGLWLGNKHSGAAFERLSALDVSAIVNLCSGELPTADTWTNPKLEIPAEDDLSFDLVPAIVTACQFIDTHWRPEERGGVLIHCKAGASRSATVLVAYIAMRFNVAPGSVLRLVERKRPVVDPNSHFRRQLTL